jgi:hypothetical protein
MAATGNALGDDDDDDEEADERKGNGSLANGRRPRLMLVAAVAASLGKKGEKGGISRPNVGLVWQPTTIMAHFQ